MTDHIEAYLNNLDFEALREKAAQEQQHEEAQESEAERIRVLPLAVLREAPDTAQCFRAADETRMQMLTESIRRNGVLALPIVRPLADGEYEIIAGRNRCRAARALGYRELSCIVRRADDDTAAELQIADNFQHREVILPSEKAKAYQRRLDSIRRKAGRPSKSTSTQLVSKFAENSRDKNCDQAGHNFTDSSIDKNCSQAGYNFGDSRIEKNSDQAGQNYVDSSTEKNSRQAGENFADSRSVEKLAADSPDSKSQIQRYIRLNYLIPSLLQWADDGKIGLQLGATLSYLSELTQTLVYDYLTAHPTQQLTQTAADELRKLDTDDIVDEATLAELLSRRPQRALRVVKLKMKPIRQYFPDAASEEEITQTVQAALEYYFSHIGDAAAEQV